MVQNIKSLLHDVSGYKWLGFPHIHLFADCVVCRQDYTKTTEQISTKRRWRMGIGSEQTPLPFGFDPDNGTDAGIFISLSLTLTLYCVIGPFSTNLLICQGKMHGKYHVDLYHLMCVQVKILIQQI